MPPFDDCLVLAILSVVLFCMYALSAVRRHIDRGRHDAERARLIEINRDMTDRLWRLASNRDTIADRSEEMESALKTVNANVVALGRLIKRAGP